MPPSSVSEIRPFGDYARRLAAAGFAVVPARGKRPVVAGFNKWRHAPHLQTVDAWVASHANADIAYIPGLSGARGRSRGLVVVDADSADAVRQIIPIFGDSPGKVITKRGMHLLFTAPLEPLSDYLGPAGVSLKSLGLEVDVKYGSSIVMAPPSRHQLDHEFHYCWAGCDEAVLYDLPVFDIGALRALIERRNTHATIPGRGSARGAFRMGSRGLALNDALVPVIHFFENLDEALDYARTFNSNFEECGFAPLDDEEVARRTAQVWADRDRLERRIGLRATASTDAEEIRHVVATYPNGADVLALVQLLRAEHGARDARGEGFHLFISAMVERRVLGSWSALRYRRARDAAIDAGLIRVLRPETRGRPTLYALVKRKSHPAKRPIGGCQ